MKISSLQSYRPVAQQPQVMANTKQQNPIEEKTIEIDLNKLPNSTPYTASFKAATPANISDRDKYMNAKEIRIPNLVDLDADVHIPWEALETEEQKKLNSLGLNIESKTNANGTAKYIVITNNKVMNKESGAKQVLFFAKVKPGIKLPTLTYKQGKFMPEITIKHESLGGKRVKMFAGSKIEGKGFRFVMPGENRRPDGTIDKIKIPTTQKQDVSFTGNLITSVLTKEEQTRNSVTSYMQDKLYENVIPGKYKNEVIENEVQGIMPAGGFGERFYNLTRENENKPTYYLPTDKGFRIIGSTLNMFASAGIIEGNEKDKLTYLSQKHEIKGDDVVDVKLYKTDGGALAEGIEKGTIKSDKDAIILNADIFTNADITRAYHKFKEYGDAAIVIPYCLFAENRAKSFGLMGVENTDEKMQIKEFVEKPQYISEPPTPPLGLSYEGTDGDEAYAKAMTEYNEHMRKYIAVKNAKDTETGKYYSNPGMYILSPQALEVLKNLKNKAGLGDNVMKEIVRMCNAGELKTADGRPMKAYTVPLQRADGELAYWDDIGTAEAYLKVMKDVAYETSTNGTGVENKFYGVPTNILNDFKDNVDLNTSIVYLSKDCRKAFDDFKTEFGVTKAEGNIFVAA